MAEGFTEDLYAFYRRPNGAPRTPRDPDSGLPSLIADGLYMPRLVSAFLFDHTTRSW
ncbi:unnamed protein product [Protopolystoma xenopodis]|uniref:Uncharacterized protein n=1 Tax=Protopolystoma xenopodis TaxID=117903 RepID=A0A3S5AMF1_9PLAT|nr:unnamed protein product [Protopolystoma xenopodis]